MTELTHARGECPGALLHEPVQQRRRGRELPGRFDAHLRCNVTTVQHELAVAAAFEHMGDAEQRVALGGVACAQQPQIGHGSLHRFGIVAGMGVVTQLFVDDTPAPQLGMVPSPKSTSVTPGRASGTARPTSSSCVSGGTSSAVGAASYWGS